MTLLFNSEGYKEATVNLLWGSSYGTIAVYLISPLLISVFSWKAVFLFCGICGGVMLLIWIRSRFTIVRTQTEAATDKGNYRFLFSPLMIGLMIALIRMGALRDGITTWMPSYIGSAISTYGIAVLSEHFGWQVTLLTWLSIAVTGTCLCLMCIRPWYKTHHEQ